MGLTAVVENEAGEPLERVEDPTNILHRLLPGREDKSFRWIGTIDWYGDTVFNHLQMDLFLEEWRRIATQASEPVETALMRAIEEMAVRVVSERHLYLKFYGD